MFFVINTLFAILVEKTESKRCPITFITFCCNFFGTLLTENFGCFVIVRIFTELDKEFSYLVETLRTFILWPHQRPNMIEKVKK